MQAADCSEMIRMGLTNAGWDTLTEVQSVSLPYLLRRVDVMVQAKTGSGKTGAFVLPLLESIDPLVDACQALVLVPTRELALQVVDEATTLLANSGLNVVPVYGGVGYGQQIQAFREGAHIVVGTPGRILDHLSSGKLRLDDLHTLVFDEADRMLSMGFYPDMIDLKRYLPERPCHTGMFSATFPPTVRSLAYQFQRDPVMLDLSTDAIHVEEVAHVAYVVDPMEKDRALVRLLEIENPEAAIIFCNTKQRVNYVTVILQRSGFDVDQLTSDLAQNAREKVLDRIRERKLRFLVATDVAARGLDIPHLSHAIQYELPEDLEIYIHRAGRTGRAGAGGTAFSLVAGLDELKLYQLVKQYEIDFDRRPAPSEVDVHEALAGRLFNRLAGERERRDALSLERADRYVPFIQSVAADAEKARLIALLLDDFARHGAMTIGGEAEKEAAEAPAEEPAKRKKTGRRRGRGGRGRS